MAGVPFTRPPIGGQRPSPGSAGDAIGVTAATGASAPGPTALDGVTAPGPTALAFSPVGGAPPVGGGWWLYQRFSRIPTSRDRPIWRNQSTERTPKLPPPRTV